MVGADVVAGCLRKGDDVNTSSPSTILFSTKAKGKSGMRSLAILFIESKCPLRDEDYVRHSCVLSASFDGFRRTKSALDN